MSSQPEIYRILKLGDHMIAPGLPVVENWSETKSVNQPVSAEVSPANKARVRAFVNFLKQHTQHPVVFYPVLFLSAFIFFYSVLNLPSFVSQVSGWFAPPEDEQILGENLSAYYKWIGGYYFAVGNKELLEPNADIDKDGLTNLDEFHTRTNPTVADSDQDGTNDGLEIIQGTNPWGLGAITKSQQALVDEVDLIRINNRISYNTAEKLAARQGNPLATALAQDKPRFDLTKPGTLSIPKLNLQVPIIWTKDPADFETDLTQGVVHYPGTSLPGEQGTMYVSGHSSDYFWKNHPYTRVFAKLNALAPGDDVFVDVHDSNGQLKNFRYRVVGSNIHHPDDQAQFIDNSAAKLNLSTCWPIGTQKDRLVVSAVLEGI